MPEYTLKIKPPEKMDLTITGTDSQQLTLPADDFTEITVDYEGDTLIFEGKKTKAIASLRCIGDLFWMTLSLSTKGFEIEPNESLEMLKKLNIVKK